MSPQVYGVIALFFHIVFFPRICAARETGSRRRAADNNVLSCSFRRRCYSCSSSNANGLTKEKQIKSGAEIDHFEKCQNPRFRARRKRPFSLVCRWNERMEQRRMEGRQEAKGVRPPAPARIECLLCSSINSKLPEERASDMERVGSCQFLKNQES